MKIRIGDLMTTYLKSSEKHAFDRPCFTFKFYSSIIVSSLVLLDVPSLKRGVVEVDLSLEQGIIDTNAIP